MNKRFLSKYGIIIVLIIVVVIFSLTSVTFLTSNNIINVIRQSSVIIILAMGMTYVIISGGIDLSISSLAALVGTLTASMIVSGMSVWGAIILCLVLGMGCGALNGLMIAKANVPPFMATLAMMAIARGTILVYTGGYPVYGLPESFIIIGSGYVVGIPIPVIIMLIICIIACIIMDRTTFGRSVYAVGGNEKAARLSGISVSSVKIKVYIISGFTAAIGGIILTARLASGQPALGAGLELDAIAAVILGGASLSGGRGKVWGSIFGAVIMVVIGNGLNLLGISGFWQQIVKGTIIAVAVMSYSIHIESK